MTATPTLVRASLSAQIRDELLSRILSGALQPGDRLVELKIAAEMETSQAPVREALRELEAMGVVESVRNKGARVRVLSDTELRDVYDVRAQLEGFASARAAHRRAPLKTRLARAVRRMRQAARADDLVGFARHNADFHRAIVVAAGNQVLLELWETLNVKVRTNVNVMRHDRDLAAIADSHLPIVDAIAAGDPPRARAAAEAHVLQNRPGT